MKLKTILKIVGSTLVTVIILFAAAWAWLSFGPVSAVKEKVYELLPLPAAAVNGHLISTRTFLARYQMAEHFVQSSGQPEPTNLKDLVFSQLVDETKLSIIAQNKGVSATAQEIDDEYNRRKTQQESQQPGSFEQQLKNFGVDDAAYKNELIKSNVTAVNLTSWFYSQRSLNTSAYVTVDAITQSLAAGAKFEDLAKTYSEDQQTKTLGGDAGFVELDKTLPEVQNALKSSSATPTVANSAIAGQVVTIPTRYGIEVVQIEGLDHNGENGELREHLRQIFISGSDFNSWYSQKTKNFKIIKIIKL